MQIDYLQSGIRIGEFGARVLPAVGKLAADLIQKPAFKIKPASGSRICSRLY